jgi:hypothetical protein
MADFRAIMAVSEAVVNLLRVNYRPEDFNNELEFRVFTSKDFGNNTLQNGASLFPYRIYANGAHRTPPGRVGLDGRPLRSVLPVELHFLITVWGKDASLQNTLAGWIMRTLEDTPSLPAGILNSVVPDCFRPDETVDITLAELRTEDMFRIWDVIGLNVYQLSIPYLARIIHIESVQPRAFELGELVQDRRLDMGLVQ